MLIAIAPPDGGCRLHDIIGRRGAAKKRYRTRFSLILRFAMPQYTTGTLAFQDVIRRHF